MSLPRIFEHPLSLLDSFEDDNAFFSRFPWMSRTQDDNGHSAFMPACDITEKNNSFEINAELPGMDKKDINVSLKDGVLHIEAESSSEEEEKEGDKLLRRERRYGKYVRRFNLGKNVKDDEVKASFKNGVLKLSVPKQAAQKEVIKKITIN